MSDGPLGSAVRGNLAELAPGGGEPRGARDADRTRPPTEQSAEQAAVPTQLVDLESMALAERLPTSATDVDRQRTGQFGDEVGRHGTLPELISPHRALLLGRAL